MRSFCNKPSASESPGGGRGVLFFRGGIKGGEGGSKEVWRDQRGCGGIKGGVEGRVLPPSSSGLSGGSFPELLRVPPLALHLHPAIKAFPSLSSFLSCDNEVIGSCSAGGETSHKQTAPSSNGSVQKQRSGFYGAFRLRQERGESGSFLLLMLSCPRELVVESTIKGL